MRGMERSEVEALIRAHLERVETLVRQLQGDGSAHEIMDEGVALTQRAQLDFVGAGVTAADVAGRTRVTIPGGGGVAGHRILDEGGALVQRADMNFVGAGVTAADSGGVTVVTIPGAAAPAFVALAKWGVD